MLRPRIEVQYDLNDSNTCHEPFCNDCRDAGRTRYIYVEYLDWTAHNTHQPILLPATSLSRASDVWEVRFGDGRLVSFGSYELNRILFTNRNCVSGGPFPGITWCCP